MKYPLLVLFLLCCSLTLPAQNDIIKIGMLPTEYADGMPLGEFKELEKNIANYIDKIERIDMVKLPNDYNDVDWGWDMQSKVEAIKQLNGQENVPYLFQIVFW